MILTESFKLFESCNHSVSLLLAVTSLDYIISFRLQPTLKRTDGQGQKDTAPFNLQHFDAFIMSAQRTTKALCIISCAILILLVAIRIIAGRADQKERMIHVALTCEGEICHALINGQVSLTTTHVIDAQADHIGFYTYHPNDKPPRNQAFRLMHLATGLPPYHQQHHWMMLKTEADGPALMGQTSYHIVPSEGLCHEGKPSDRSTVLFQNVRAQNFKLAVQLVDAVDAGILFHASDPNNGMVLVVRPRFNDVYFFRLIDGEPGPIEEIAPLSSLSTGREALRLAGLAAQMGLNAFVLLFAVYSASRLLRRFPLAKIVVSRKKYAFPLFLVIATFFLLVFCTHFSLHTMPHIEDETAYLFQAKTFAAGQLWAPAPPEPEFFEHEHMIMRNGRWFSKYPPLWSALLAVGVKIGA